MRFTDVRRSTKPRRANIYFIMNLRSKYNSIESKPITIESLNVVRLKDSNIILLYYRKFQSKLSETDGTLKRIITAFKNSAKCVLSIRKTIPKH